MLRNLMLTISLSLSTLIVSWEAHAITLDEFAYTTQNLQGQADSVSSYQDGQTSSLVQNFGGAYGGTRSIQVTSSGGGLTARFRPSYGTQPGYLTAETALSSGTLILSYDGNTTAGISDYKGLCTTSGCLNLLQGSATALSIGVWYDWPFSNTSLDIAFTFYDAKDTTGRTFSQGTITLNKRYDTFPLTQLSLPFSSLTKVGPNGAANLSNIGAFSIEVRGSGKFSYDILLGSVRTNANANVCGSGGTCVTSCNDGKDNDNDGLIDAKDPDCWKNPLDAASYDPTLDTEAKTTPPTKCQDVVDNDLDGLTDLKDPGCSSASDDDESDERSLLTVGVECVVTNVDKTKTAYFSYSNLTNSDLSLTTATDSTTLNAMLVSKVDEATVKPPTIFKKGTFKGSVPVTFAGDSVTWVVRAPQSALSQVTANANTPKCAAVTVAAECRRYRGGQVSVAMSYNNPNAFEQVIPVGALNRFTPGTESLGQPTRFAPGLNKSAFEVIVSDPALQLTWQLNGSSTVVSSNLPTCDGGCTNTSTENITGNLDKIADELSKIMTRASAALKSTSDSSATTTTSQRKRDTRDALRSKKKADRYRELAGSLTIQFPSVVKTCPEAPVYCARVDRQTTIDALRSLYANQRNSVMRTVARTYWRKRGSTSRNDKLVQQAKDLEKLGLGELAKLPRIATECK